MLYCEFEFILKDIYIKLCVYLKNIEQVLSEVLSLYHCYDSTITLVLSPCFQCKNNHL